MSREYSRGKKEEPVIKEDRQPSQVSAPKDEPKPVVVEKKETASPIVDKVEKEPEKAPATPEKKAKRKSAPKPKKPVVINDNGKNSELLKKISDVLKE